MSITGDALFALTQSTDQAQSVYPASFRGVPFAVTASESQFGRRQAIHEYPMRDRVWVEDLGRGTRRITLQGFIIRNSRIYNAPDLFTQRDMLVAACEAQGSGTLIHPTLNALTVSIPAGGLKLREGADQGGCISFTLTCVEEGRKSFALTGAEPADSTLEQSWLSTVTTAAASVIAEVKGEALTVKQAATTLSNTLAFWTEFISGAAREATTLSGSLTSTFGNLRFGRDCNGDVGGSISGLTGKVIPSPQPFNYARIVADKSAQIVRARTRIETSLSELAKARDITAVPEAVTSLIVTLLDAVPSQQDHLELLENMMSGQAFDNTYYNDVSARRMAAAVKAYLKIISAAAFTREAVNVAQSGLVVTQQVFQRGIAALDTASVLASEHGQDRLWECLEIFRENFTQVMLSHGLEARHFNRVFTSSLPALVMADRIWHDADRTGALVLSEDPIHPAFMPIAVEVNNG
ncbi:DNA circularization N-terminal domain-containing protein [Tatumella saanichensis]|uniref:DNA circularization N-terminal domain-containing protein n=1 Tax=Tatumella saanichensis TaxID=480813 RepID=UPI0004A328B0|nr:DNA circularization N-terminal domain-containing protein [Tatumella saanichensis]